MEDIKKKLLKAGLMLGGVALMTAASVIFIPVVLKKCSDKAYKNSLSKDDIDFDNLGPEIVRKETNTENNKETNNEEKQ